MRKLTALFISIFTLSTLTAVYLVGTEWHYREHARAKLPLVWHSLDPPKPNYRGEFSVACAQGEKAALRYNKRKQAYRGICYGFVTKRKLAFKARAEAITFIDIGIHEHHTRRPIGAVLFLPYCKAVNHLKHLATQKNSPHHPPKKNTRGGAPPQPRPLPFSP